MEGSQLVSHEKRPTRGPWRGPTVFENCTNVSCISGINRMHPCILFCKESVEDKTTSLMLSNYIESWTFSINNSSSKNEKVRWSMFYYARCLKEIFDLMYRYTGKKILLVDNHQNMDKNWENFKYFNFWILICTQTWNGDPNSLFAVYSIIQKLILNWL